MSQVETTDGDDLLTAIERDPDDDTVRLVYADWLQEQGEDDRAELIRVGCALSQTPHCGETQPSGIAGGVRAGCPWCTLKSREAALLGDGSRWRKGPTCAKCIGATTCAECWYTGDAGGLWEQTASGPVNDREFEWRYRVEFHRGFPRVFCPLAKVVNRSTRTTSGDADTAYGFADWTPTPWALAVITHHRGAELWASDREPYKLRVPHRENDWCFQFTHDITADAHLLPVFLHPFIEAPEKTAETKEHAMAWFPTAALARLALARALTAFVLAHRGKS